MDRKTAAGDTELQSMNTATAFYLDSPIKRGGKKVINKDSMNMMS